MTKWSMINSTATTQFLASDLSSRADDELKLQLKSLPLEDLKKLFYRSESQFITNEYINDSD